MPSPMLAAEKGFSFADPYAILLAFAGLAVLAAIGAISQQRGRAWSASLIYLGLGLVAAGLIDVLNVTWIDPLDDAQLVERLAEVAVIIALFSTGLALDRELTSRAWASVVRLLGIAMPLTIGAIALFGTQVMDLSLGAAILLGAILAPTDPVLAGEVGVGPPGEELEREAHFSLTAEAGMNDGLAFPFIFLGAFVATEGGTGWIVDWVLADVLLAIAVGLVAGAVGGYLIAAGAVRLRDAGLLSPALDVFVAVAAVLLVYGAAETAGGYGFLAAFAGGLGFRRYERDHEVHAGVHRGAELVEKVGELALILLLGSILGAGVLTGPGLTGWLLVPVLLLAIRPLAVALALVRTSLPRRERLFVAWFGVRGIGSLYYAAAAVSLGLFSAGEGPTVFWTVAAAIAVSIVVHGVSAGPLTRRLMPR